MKDDLKSLIESLHVPEREGDYWESFPNHVLRELQRPVAQRVPEPTRLTRYGWNVGLAFGCFAACFCLWQASTGPVSHVIRRQKTEIRHALLQFHDSVDKVMRDEHGLHRLIEEVQ